MSVAKVESASPPIRKVSIPAAPRRPLSGRPGDDGLLVEVHNDPDHAKSDGAQSLFPEQFDELMRQIRIIAEAIGRSVA